MVHDIWFSTMVHDIVYDIWYMILWHMVYRIVWGIRSGNTSALRRSSSPRIDSNSAVDWVSIWRGGSDGVVYGGERWWGESDGVVCGVGFRKNLSVTLGFRKKAQVNGSLERWMLWQRWIKRPILPPKHTTLWPSGLRRQTQVLVDVCPRGFKPHRCQYFPLFFQNPKPFSYCLLYVPG